jgi:RNA polymerase sigma-70 factor, ECF subfamily
MDARGCCFVVTRVTTANITQLLTDWGKGDRAALDRLVPIVHRELRQLARRELRRERPQHTLQPTALVNELFLRLVKQHHGSWQNRAQFFGVAAQLMRRILVDHARAHIADKRGGKAPQISLGEVGDVAGATPEFELLAIDRALTELAAIDPEQARLVELRFFSGMTVEETAEVLGCSTRTVKRDWRLTKAWLFGRLKRE